MNELIEVSVLARAKDIYGFLSPIRKRQLCRVMENALIREIALERTFSHDTPEANEIKARIRRQWEMEAVGWWRRFTCPARMAVETPRDTRHPHSEAQSC